MTHQESRPGTTAVPVESDIATVLEPLPLKRYFIETMSITTMALGFEVFCLIYGPHVRGFYCNDQSIRFPWYPSSVTTFELVCYALLVNACTIFTVEGYRLQHPKFVGEHYSCYEHGRTRPGRLFIRSAIFFGHSVACVLIVLTVTTVTKYSTGRLRPHFIDVCKPNIGYLICNTTAYITDYECTSGYLYSIQQARLSFFSGHSSISMSAATFFCFYLQDRLPGLIQSRVLLPIIQTLNISAALYISYTRINDNWHHWSDVAVGISVGIILTSLLCIYYAGFVPRKHGSMENERYSLLNESAAPFTVCSVCRRRIVDPEPMAIINSNF